MGERLLSEILGSGRGLIVVAARAEAEAVTRAFALEGDPREWTATRLDHRLDLLLTGIGKANAAGAVARCLGADTYRAVVNLGVCGSLPDLAGRMLPPGEAALGTAAAFADEGLLSPEGFRDVAEMGFGPLSDLPGGGVSIPCDAALVRALSALGGLSGTIATVSTCSGTDALALEIARRSGAPVEAMEGAAIALVSARLRTPFAEWRVVSNTTGDRARQRWDLRLALSRLTEAAARL
ncbi:MAG: futalosine hydrolase [Phycisphaerales bacterium]|nr:futalosine hydrolase [Phycisphaerales bacterium]